MWLGEDPRTNTGLRKDMCLKEIVLCAQNMITVLSSIINMIGDPI
jgi:hypothetical protein